VARKAAETPDDPYEGWIKFQAYYAPHGLSWRVSSLAAWCA
jgi:hypothetical protein